MKFTGMPCHRGCGAGEDEVALGRRRASAGTDRDAEVPAGPPLRVVRRHRRSINGRAALGGLLVAVSGVGVFGAYTSATADHTIPYVVAARDLQPGQRLSAADLATAPMQLPAGLASQEAFRSISLLSGAVVVAPMRSGELIQVSDVVAAADAPDQEEVSFPIDPARAVGGSLQPGETVTVLATYGTGPQAITVVVVPLAHIVAVSQASGALGAQAQEDVTLGLKDGTDALAVTNAADAAAVVLVRSTTGITADAPYRVPAGAGVTP